ncbi:putative major facilitator superfamily transporter [Nocardia asteroides NBRC 15531]|uniref:Major facilitator superfamily transporter n=1 Tax=Nocardia asteroides NBRC 15531 TaxID=1110697 RepID=U5EDU4_NOCAS|nr:putative major facilitator superfamily transporter [Nocardia asteroides NBRC 15531]SFN29866.1 Predicted arabinose efflux permease, MFS family [Nocardia asteroides]VEG36445.1 Multidrug resistance protein MdtH [Nocardia asteroides]
MTVVAKFRSFDLPARLLMINQFGINLGFYMLMPYLAGYLAGPLGLAAWAVGLVLGVRNFSQQGMFLIGGTLADRLGYKPLIVAGCLLRTGGFALLVFAESLPAVLIASAATGFAGALFNPAVRAYLAADTGERRVEAFAVFNMFYQAGILAGPLVGLALMAVDFRVTAGVAAAVFAALTIAQLFALPARRGEAPAEKTSVLDDWRRVISNRRFLAFSVAMIGSYVLSFQVYLALPLQAEFIAGARSQTLVSALFVVSGVVAVAGQLRITAWLRARWGPGKSLVAGMAVLAAAFIPLIIVPTPGLFGTVAAVTALLMTTTLLAIGTAAVFPFEMDTVVSLSGNKLVATHYGFYNTVVGVGILVGNLATGTLVGAAREAGLDWVVWAGLTAIGVLAAYALARLERTDRTTTPEHVTGRHRLPSGRHRLTEPAVNGSDPVTTPLRRRPVHGVEPVNRFGAETRPTAQSDQRTYRRQPVPPRLRPAAGEDRLGPAPRVPSGAPRPWPTSEPERRGHRRVAPPAPRPHPSAEDRRSRYPAAGPETRR